MGDWGTVKDTPTSDLLQRNLESSREALGPLLDRLRPFVDTIEVRCNRRVSVYQKDQVCDFGVRIFGMVRRNMCSVFLFAVLRPSLLLFRLQMSAFRAEAAALPARLANCQLETRSWAGGGCADRRPGESPGIRPLSYCTVSDSLQVRLIDHSHGAGVRVQLAFDFVAYVELRRTKRRIGMNRELRYFLRRLEDEGDEDDFFGDEDDFDEFGDIDDDDDDDDFEDEEEEMFGPRFHFY